MARRLGSPGQRCRGPSCVATGHAANPVLFYPQIRAYPLGPSAAAEPALPRLVVVRGEERRQVVDHAVERFGREQNGLVAGDVVLERAHPRDVPGPDLGAAELLDLPVRREEAAAVGLELPALV